MRFSLIAALSLALALAASLAAPLAQAQQTIRILPDQAILACQAHTMHALEERGAVAPSPVQRFATERMDDFMFKVTGLFEARFDEEPRQVDVSCDVSSNGVEVFTMVIEPMN